MEIKELLADEDAVSPVIGVILMVAITVILAAVIGTFVLGLGDQVNNNAPSATFQFDYDDGGDGSFGSGADGDYVNITHDGGDTIDPGDLSLNVGGTEISDVAKGGWTTDVNAGATLDLADTGSGADVNADFESDDQIRVVWTNPSGGSTNTIGSSTVP